MLRNVLALPITRQYPASRIRPSGNRARGSGTAKTLAEIGRGKFLHRRDARKFARIFCIMILIWQLVLYCRK